MGRYNFTALRVRRRALQSLEAGQTTTRPVWLDVIGKIPPAQVFIRKLPQRHPDVRQTVRTIPPNPKHALPDGSLPPARTEVVITEVKHRKEPRMTLKPRKMMYQEDTLRARFYKDHPWELARPRIVLENDGRDAERLDWSTGIEQHQNGKKLDGESVVQRQLWLISNVPDMTISRAYDIARGEFYSARQQEDIERRIATEEAEYFGAQFQPDVVKRTMPREDEAYNDWEIWARQQVLERQQKRAAFTGENANAPAESPDAAVEAIEDVADPEEKAEPEAVA